MVGGGGALSVASLLPGRGSFDFSTEVLVDVDEIPK